MFRASVAAILPVKLAIAWAETLRSKGDTEAALAIVKRHAEGLASGDPWSGRIHYLHGRLLLDVGRKAAAADPLLRGYEQTRQDAAAFSFLASQLLQQELRPETFAVIAEFFESPLADGANERLLRERLQPFPRRAVSPYLESWNRTISARHRQWAWPHVHLAVLAAARDEWSSVAGELEQASALRSETHFTRALRAYALARQSRGIEALRLLDPFLPAGPIGRAALLLRGHAYRLAGRYAAAAASFAPAYIAQPLLGDDLLCYAEAALNGGDAATARTLLACVSKRDDPRVRLLAAACAEAPDEALRWLTPLASRWRDSAASICASAVLRYATSQLGCGPQEIRQALKTIDAALANMPNVAQRADVTLAHAALLAAGQCVDAAHARLQELVRSDGADAEALLLYARCSLHLKRLEECDAALARLDDSDPRVMRVGAACRALHGRYDEALECLDAGASSVHRDALLYLAGKPAAASAYYTAAAAARRGDLQAASSALASIPPADALHPAASRLSGWIRLQEARVLAESGELPRAAKRLGEAMESLEVDAAVVSSMEPLLPHLIETDARPAMRALLAASPARERCHRAGIFHLCEADRCARAGNWSGALAEWESAIACITVAVSDDDYISQWAGNRYRVYQVDPEDHRAGEGILAQLARSIDRWRKLLGDRGQHDVAECIGALSIALRAEEKGARLLWTAVRSEEEKAPLPCAIGPLGIRHFAMEDEVAAFVDRLRRRSESPANELLAQLMRFFDRDHAETLDDEKATVERLERMFSVLRHAAVLDDDGQLEAALEQLRKQQGNGVGRAEFGRCNPAFAIAGGSELLEGAARKFEIALLLRLGEQEVSSAEDRVDRGVAYWRAALALADGDASAATIASIHKIAVGRAHALDRRERVPEAIRLLDAVNDLCGDGTILGELATLHAHRAIMVANESKDWETAVDELRKARELNSRSQFIDRNFVIALRQRAHQIFEEQQADSYQLLREALAVAETLLRTDPDNSESQSFVAETRAELLFMFPGNMGRSVPIRRPMPGRGSGAGAREHRERGLLHARAGQYHAAAEELQSALRDDPGDAQARQELADVLMHMLSG